MSSVQTRYPAPNIMITLIEDNKQFNYQIYRSSTIVEQQDELVSVADLVVNRIKLAQPDRDMTWSYNQYNTFLVTAPSIAYTNLLKDLLEVIKIYTNDSKPMWMQSWINYHMPEQVLNWHDHYWPIHGYMSITPQDTTTEFEKYSIKNEVGNIYIGPGYRPHRVVVNKQFNQPRITLGYDLHNTAGTPLENYSSLMPVY
jgi:hypothetical protein